MNNLRFGVCQLSVRQLRAAVASIGFVFAASGMAAVPDFQITGPIVAQAPGHPSKDFVYSASAIELESRGYVEEEYFIEGIANRYSAPEMENAEVLDSGHRYRTRLVVRRPTNPAQFNGVAVVEWINVTGGPDKDIDWWQSGEHFIKNGYAYLFVSAQMMGIDTMKQASPQRYQSLDITHDGMLERDEASYDIFAAVGKSINRTGETQQQGQPDILGGLKAEIILATGHSQSASRLATYLNNIHPLEPIYDGVMVHGGGGRIRDDQDVKIFKIMAETDMPRRAAAPQPASDSFRQWEVAGTSHVDVPFEIEYAKVRNLAAGLSIENLAPRDSGCELPAYSQVPFRDVMNAAFEHLVVWVRDDAAPPIAQPLQVARMMPELEFARDEQGNILGGIRLAAHAVPTATNTGMNTGDNRFCFLYGSHQPFAASELNRLYPTNADYIEKVRQAVEQNLADGFILPEAAIQTLEAAQNGF
ncbi:MAG: hypothetical protein ACI95C_002199 [Pseudohongiellaceae bacterium]|jgi:hypothetical protein